MAAQSSAERRRYLRHVVRHPLHLLFVSCVLPTLVFFTWSIAAGVAALLAETGALCFVHRMPAFRRWVDERVREQEGEAASQMRTALLARLTETHRLELQQLEALADAIRERVVPARGGTRRPSEDCLGIGHLLAAYVGGAIAYAEGRASIAATDRGAIAAEITALDQVARAGREGAHRALAVERLRIARMRAARWDRSLDDLEIIREQLALIAALVRLTHENATAPVRSPAFDDTLGRAVTTIAEGERAVREIVELLAIDASPEPQMLEMGRRASRASRTTLTAEAP